MNAANTTAEPSSETAKTPKAPKAPKETRAQFAYHEYLKRFPRPGGEGAHVGLYRLGIMGCKASIHQDTVIADVSAKLDEYASQGSSGRLVSPAEIEQSVHAGFNHALDIETGEASPDKAKEACIVKPEMFATIARANAGATVASIMAKSPVPLDFPEWEAGWRAVDALYTPTDMLYIGGAKDAIKLGVNIRPAAEWVGILKKGPPAWQHIIPNTLTGEEAMKKDGSGMTYRGDGCVARYRHAVVEMDNASLEDQLAFWSWCALPVRALILSGGKSIHGWVDVDCANALEWGLEVSGGLFQKYLVPLGCDPACRNASRVSRLPGHIREDKKAMQKLIWLSPEGKAVCE